MIRVVFLLICVTLLCGSALARALAPDTPACPKPTITALGPTTFCQGGSVMLSSSDATNERYVSTVAYITGCDTDYTTNPPTPFFCGAGTLYLDFAKNLYVSAGNGNIHKITKSGKQTALKLNHYNRYEDNLLNNAFYFVLDNKGNVYTIWSSNAQANEIYICKLSPSGDWDTLAGGTVGYLDGIGLSAKFNYLFGIAFDADSNLIVSDQGCIRKVTLSGVVTTVAGIPNRPGYANGPANKAQFYGGDIAIDAFQNIYMADAFNRCIRKISSHGMVSTLAGDTLVGYIDAKGSAARFWIPGCIDVDVVGNLYVSDNNRVRKITPDGTVSTIAGSGPYYPNFGSGYLDGPALAAMFGGTSGIFHDSGGNLFVGDQGNQSIRKISFASAGYLWNTGDTTKNLSVSKPGTYSVQTISGGCTSAPSEPVTVSVKPIPATVAITPLTDTIACPGYVFGLQAPAIPADQHYLWSSGDTLQTITLTQEGAVTLQITGANGCPSLASRVTLRYRRPSLAGNNPYICPNFTDSVTYTVSGLPGSVFNWQVAGGELLAAKGNQALISWNSSASQRIVSVTETDSAGCQNPAVQLRVLLDSSGTVPGSGCSESISKLFIPNIFTPGPDPVNNTFFIPEINHFPENRLTIYNRWGRRILEAAPYTNNWDGAGCPAGTYYYLLTDGNNHLYKGWVQLYK